MHFESGQHPFKYPLTTETSLFTLQEKTLRVLNVSARHSVLTDIPVTPLLSYRLHKQDRFWITEITKNETLEQNLSYEIWLTYHPAR